MKHNILDRIIEKIEERRFTGEIRITFNTGGVVGYRIFKPDKEFEKEIKDS